MSTGAQERSGPDLLDERCKVAGDGRVPRAELAEALARAFTHLACGQSSTNGPSLQAKANQSDIRIRIVLQHTSLHGLDAVTRRRLAAQANGTAAMPCHAMRTVECTASAHRIT